MQGGLSYASLFIIPVLSFIVEPHFATLNLIVPAFVDNCQASRRHPSSSIHPPDMHNKLIS